MGQYSTVVSLATENRSCVYTSELLVSNIPFLYLSLLSFGLNMTSSLSIETAVVSAVWHISGISAYTSVWFSSMLLHPPDWAHMSQSRFSLWLTSDQSRFVHTIEKRDWSKVSPREKRDWSKLSPREKRDWLMWAYFGLTLAQSKGPNFWAFAGTGKRHGKRAHAAHFPRNNVRAIFLCVAEEF